MKLNIKTALYIVFVVFTGDSIVFLMASEGWIPDPGWWIILAWAITVPLADYLIDKHDEWLFTRKVIRVAKAMAHSQGIDPKTIKKENVRFKGIDRDGNIRVEVRVKKGEQEK